LGDLGEGVGIDVALGEIYVVDKRI